MREQKMGIDYFCIGTDIKDDDKVFALRHHYATADGGYDIGAGYMAFGRFVDVLADIYREGFAAEMNLSRRIRLSQQLGLTPDGLDDFIGECVNAGLFDRRLWEEHRVLTSRGIQKRYYIVASRRVGTIPESQRRWLLPDEDDPGDDPDDPDGAAAPSEADEGKMQHDDTSCTHDADMMQQDDATGTKAQAGHSATSCIQDADKMKHDAESCPLREEKERKEKLNQREENEIARAMQAGPDAILSSLAKTLSTPVSKRTKKHTQPYPLSCMSMAGGGSDRYEDGMGTVYDNPWDALVQHLRQRCPDIDIGSFSQRVAATCPAGCCESRDCVNECFGLISKALGKFNRNKCASPIPLICKVLTDERTGVAA